MQKEQIKSIIASKGYTIISEKRLPNNCGDVLKLNNDCIINCYDKGTHNCQGKNAQEIKELLDNSSNINFQSNRSTGAPMQSSAICKNLHKDTLKIPIKYTFNKWT